MTRDSSAGLMARLFGRRPVEAANDGGGAARLRAAFGRVLRDFADLGVAVEEGDARRRMATISAAADALLRDADDEEAGGTPLWGEVRSVFATQRRAERLYVSETVDGLKKALRDVAQGLSRALEGDRGGDGRVKETMQALRELAHVATTDVGRLRHAVIQAVEVVEQATHERAVRHQRQLERLSSTMEALRVELRDARRRAETDALTGLDNRAAFDVHVAGTVALGALRASPATLLLLDLDAFKSINDRHGHPAGDAVLRAVAGALRTAGVRESDMVARFGGEEFALVLHDCRGPDARRVAERIREAVRALVVRHEGVELSVTVSIGVAERGPDEAAAAWIERADRALYAAKQAGRDRVRVAC